MDKEAFLTHTLKANGELSTLLGGQQPISVINNSKYVPPLTYNAQVTDKIVGVNFLSVDDALHTALSDEEKTVILFGPEGSGKTTALLKLVVDWTKGEQLQKFSHVFHFQFRELNSLDGMLSLEKLLHHHGHFPPESMPLILQKPENLLFIFDELDQYKHSLDPDVHSLCSDPSQEASVSCLVASLLHGALLKGAAILVATRLTECLKFLSGTRVDLLGFLKPQRETYFNAFFSDAAFANKALTNMERTLGFYDFSASPRFCWTVCSIYKSLMDAGEKLPETLTQLCVGILSHVIQTLSLSKACIVELISALGKMASHCCLDEHSQCTKEDIDSTGFQQLLTCKTLTTTFLRVDGDVESDGCVFSFHSEIMQEFLLAVSFFLDKSVSEGVNMLLEKHKGQVKFLDLFLAGLSEPDQRRPLETLLGDFNSDHILDFKCWMKSSSKETLERAYKEKHFHCFRLLHQSQNETWVKEIITPLAQIGISYGDLTQQDCVALNYVVMCLGEMEQLNLYRTKDLTEEEAEMLAPAMGLSQKIILSDSSLRTGAVSHLASALSRGRTTELNLYSSKLGDEKLKILCTGLRDCKLRKLNLSVCSLTEACCEDLVSVLTSGTSQLCVLEMQFNEIGDNGFRKLCKALQSPQCKLQDLQLRGCKLTAASMKDLSAALRSGQSELRKVNLMHNTIGDSGVEFLSLSLKEPLCKLESLILFDSQLTGGCCAHLMEVLKSEHCRLLELDLSVNDLGQDGALLLCQGLSTAGCPLEKLGLVRCELTSSVFKELGSLLRSETCRLKSLSVGLNSVGDQGVKLIWDAIVHPSCLLEELDVEMTGLTDACVKDLCAAVRASKSLKILDLKNNTLTDASVPALIQVMRDNHNMENMNLQYNDFSEDVFNMLDKCSRIRY